MNNIIIRYISILLFCSLSLTAFAQKTVVSGTVKDKITKLPIPGATVVEVGANDRFINGTTADVNGNFVLPVSKDACKVRVSFIGYDNRSETGYIGRTLNVLLTESEVSINEITVTTTKSITDDDVNVMMPISRRDMSTATVKIATSELPDMPASSIEEMLQGQLSGVDITGGNGDPGAGLNIRIRGMSSLNPNAQPLIVVDGLPYETQMANGFDFSTADEDQLGAVLDISPSDIESIEVLKDAAASAVWGAKGADGVLIITTKRGVKGSAKFEINHKTSVSFRPEEMPILSGDQYVMLQKEGIFNARGEYGAGTFKQLDYDMSWYNYHNFAQNTKWLDEITRTGLSNETNFSVSGGGDKSRYRASASYLNQQGNTRGTMLERFNAKINLNYNVSRKLSFTADFSYVHGNNDRTYENLAIRGLAYTKMPNMSVYKYDEYGNMSNQYFAPYTDNYQSSGPVSYNLLALANEAKDNSTNNRVNTKVSLNYKFINSLSLFSVVSMDINAVSDRAFLPAVATGAPWNNADSNRAKETNNESVNTQTFTRLTYQPSWGKNHRFTSVFTFSTNDSKSNATNIGVAALPSDEIFDATADGRLTRLAASSGRTRNVAFLINTNYVLYDRYIITAGIRTDGDSRFGAANRWGYFPSMSVAWRLSGEKFMKSLTWINDLKIRASYGNNGRTPSSAYSHYAKYSLGESYIDGDMQSVSIQNIQLTNLKWETVIQKNLGFDFTLLKNRVTGSFELYSKESKDVIFNGVGIPTSSGFGSLQHVNWGSIMNKGWEFNVNANIYRNKQWNVGANFNISQNQNTVSEVPDYYKFERYSFSNGTYAKRLVEGQPIGSFYGYRYNGVYSTSADAVAKDKYGQIIYDLQTGLPMAIRAQNSTGYRFMAGDAQYEDLNNDGVIDMYDITYLGNSNPRFIGGFGFNVSYKRITMRATFHYKYDYDVINRARMNAENMYTRDNQSTATLRRWRKEGDITDIPRALNNRGFNYLGSDRFVEDASFVKLKSINVSYSFDKQKLKKTGLNDIRVYATLYNPLTFTKYTGQDPEIGMGGNDIWAVGVDNARTPSPRSIVIGVNVLF